MSVFIPKGRKHWSYSFQIEGVRFRKGTGQTSREAAKRIEAKARTEAALSLKFPKRQAMTLNAASERYYQEVAQHQPSAADTDYMLENLVTGLGAEARLSDLGNNDFTLYIARRRAKVSNASVNREVQLARRVFRRADKLWQVDVGQMPNWSALLLPEPEPRTRSLSCKEEEALFEHLRPDYHGLMLFAMLTGVRLSNALRLTWRQVDLDAGVITFKGKSRKPGGKTILVPITPAEAAILAAERGRHPIFVFTYECKRSRHLRRKGQRYPFSKNGWRKDWAKALEKAKIEDFRFHDLRHTAATRTLRASGNLKLLKEMLGHEDISSTVRYAHVIGDDIRAAKEKAQRHHSATAADAGEAKALNEKEK